MYKISLIDEDGIAHVIFTIRSENGERKYVVESKNGKFYHSCTRKVCKIRKVIFYFFE